MADKTPEEIALERIEEAVEKEATELNLAEINLAVIPSSIRKLTKLRSLVLTTRSLAKDTNKITSIPAEIGELINLRHLYIADNAITHLPAEIGRLRNLQSLEIGYNELIELPNEIWQLEKLIHLGLYGNRLSSISAQIRNLTKLRHLQLGINALTDIPVEIFQLKYLEELGLSYNKWSWTIPPKELGNLTKLRMLNLGNANITRLPPEIKNLELLEEIYLWQNRIEDLPPEIGNLSNLRVLSLTDNQIKKLPPEIKRLTNLKTLDLTKNPIKIPPEILNKDNEPKEILNYYFGTMEKSLLPLSQAKVLFLGQGSVGKTSLVRRLIQGDFDAQEDKTEGISVNQFQIDSKARRKGQQRKITLNIWDFGGQEIMHATHQFFLTKRSLYLLVLDSRLTQEENRVEYWLKIIQSFGGESPVLIVGNKIDQHPLDIDRTGLQKKYPNIVGILETSAATGAGIEELKTAITEQVNHLPHVRDLLPETWFTVKTKLEGLGRETNFITHDKYLDLCAENEVSDETSQRTLIGFLHDLGVVLHFQDDPRLEALGILNPQWVTNGVYKILNSHALFQNKGVLTVAMLDEILNLPKYPRGKRLFIVDMMKKFELCYDIEPDKTFLVPDLLPKDESSTGEWNDVLAFQYQYPVLPSSVITRFIVRMNRNIAKNIVWRTGVMLQIGENRALVKADGEERKVYIFVNGPEYTRRDALATIRNELDTIHASIKGLNPDRKVPIPGYPKVQPLDYQYLLKLEHDGYDFFPVDSGHELIKVNVKKLLNGVDSEEKRRTTNIFVGGNVDHSNIVVGDNNITKKSD